ncbi:MAG: UDP-N-acetylmuramoyl-L-alanine--D-glutamate ligase [Firmicutes bacterium]|nr:UDP-N-acetylmuramoyl-L-alanine--D-glutamate ligase [Bacillota bacterium]
MNEWAGKKVAVVGLGISNISLIRYLAKQNAVISGRDYKLASELGNRYQTLKELGVECQLGEDYLADLQDYDAVFLTPGIPKYLPEIQAIKHKVPILSEISLVLKQAKAPVFGITGSSGKTTTTTLVGEMVKASGLNCHVGGNIGNPLIENIDEIPSEDRIIMELSSFQLELLDQSPDVALITNISENHLDIHLTMDNYINAKKQIYLHQKPSDIAIFNYDDSVTFAMSKEAVAQVYYFSTKHRVKQGTYLEKDQLIFQDQAGLVQIIAKQDIGLMGEHNVQNILAAALIAHLAGASWQAIRKVAREFTGVAHRLEKVAVVNQVVYYNDSIATSPSRTIAGLNAFSQPIILIAGGYDKKLSFKNLAEIIGKKVKELILLGAAADKINQEVDLVNSTFTRIHRVNDLAEAVMLARDLAEPGDVVLLSPACASYDMYPDFSARGEHFCKLVHNMAADRL